MKDFLDYASERYYEGTPIITDAEFDTLVSTYDYHDVGYKIRDGVKHFFPMYSLKNYWDLNNPPFDLSTAVVTPKLDGAAIAIVYVNGQLQIALTRGDGKVGRDITKLISNMDSVPKTIPVNRIVQINGEVVCPKEIKNARNVASGALNLKDIQEALSRGIKFIAYDFQVPKGSICKLWSQDMEYVSEGLGFMTVLAKDLSAFPTDGKVYRVDEYRKFKELGYTSKHPRGAFALKNRELGHKTKLLDVTWQVGKSGVVSPVAILEPVEIGGAMVSRATLHNIEYIRGLDLEIGCDVEVIRSGEIIPRIIGRV